MTLTDSWDFFEALKLSRPCQSSQQNTSPSHASHTTTTRRSSELLYSPPSARPMAPSRAAGLLFPRSSPTMLSVSSQITRSCHLNTASRIRATQRCTKSHYAALRMPFLRVSIKTQAKLPCGGSSAARRLYSTNAAEAPDAAAERPEAPDHLDEKEKAIFDRLSKALDPTALEVLLIPSPILFLAGVGSIIDHVSG
jgi:hypothetical protein